MAIDVDGFSVSFDCTELIDELSNDILEFGEDYEVFAFFETKKVKTLYGDKIVEILNNYDFESTDTEKNIRASKMKMRDVLTILEQQDGIV